MLTNERQIQQALFQMRFSMFSIPAVQMVTKPGIPLAESSDGTGNDPHMDGLRAAETDITPGNLRERTKLR